MILHADLPEDLAAVPAGHGELQRVVVGVLLEDAAADISMDEGKKRCRAREMKHCMDLQQDLLLA